MRGWETAQVGVVCMRQKESPCMRGSWNNPWRTAVWGAGFGGVYAREPFFWGKWGNLKRGDFLGIKSLRDKNMSNDFARCRGNRAWYDRAIFYHIYPLGMLDGVGNLSCLVPLLDALGALDIGAIYLGPVFRSSTHGYDTIDYFHVDSRLGSDEDLAYLVSECHKRGIRVILDGVFNHVGREFWGFKEALRDGPQSIAWRWFVGLREDSSAPNGVRYDTWEGHESLVKLDLSNPDTRNHLLAAVDSWIERFDIDGLRLDAADCLTEDFIRELRRRVDSRKSDFYLMGEVIHGDYRRWANDEMFDGTTNYEAYKGLWSSHNDSNFFEIAYTLNRQFGANGIYRGLSMYNFVENHDVDRLATRLYDKRDIATCYALMYTMPGIPSIYYGGEWAVEGKKGTGFDADKPIRPSYEVQNLIQGNIPNRAYPSDFVHGYLKRLGDFRRNRFDLMDGDYEQIFVSSKDLVFRRNSTICAVSKSDERHELEVCVAPGRYAERFYDGGIFEAYDGKLRWCVEPHSLAVFEKIDG